MAADANIQNAYQGATFGSTSATTTRQHGGFDNVGMSNVVYGNGKLRKRNLGMGLNNINYSMAEVTSELLNKKYQR